MTMTVLELAEPLFQYTCCLNRSAKHGAHDYPQVRREIDDVFREMRARAEKEPGLASQLEQVERPLVFFVDAMISTGPYGFAAEWNDKRLAYELEPPDLAGDQSFFEMLDSTLALKDRSEQIGERLAVYYTCIGLGMKGMYMDQPAILQRKMQDCASRMRSMMESTPSRICPAAYENIDDRDMVPKDQTPIWAIGIALAVMVVGSFVLNFMVFQSTSSELKEALHGIINSADQVSTEQLP